MQRLECAFDLTEMGMPLLRVKSGITPLTSLGCNAPLVVQKWECIFDPLKAENHLWLSKDENYFSRLALFYPAVIVSIK